MPTLLRRTVLGAAALTGAALLLAGCATADPLSSGSTADADSDTIVVGSQQYYSNEIIAEIYAQALEAADYTVDRQFNIGQREIYVPEIESGAIDLFPEYTGPLLEYWDGEETATTSDAVYTALTAAMPDGLRALEQSPATDQDSYVVTQDFAAANGLTTIADLAKVTTPMTLGGNAEGETRPNGPKGLLAAYGVNVGYTTIQDGGGPLTIKALQDGSVQLAVLYTASPLIQGAGLVTLEDPDGYFLASNVVPLASDKIDADAEAIINRISAAMTPEGLIALNAQSVDEQASAAVVAAGWLAEHDVQ
jgi:osmoprotectant transport system substrate-binding protein